ncbi:MAG: YitT family protein, partial [Pyramidobacter sp.]|nr:YitT family protein [Pyramidobacter sp.]
IDWVLRSFDRRTQMTIISPQSEKIVGYIMNTLDRTATLISARGAYLRLPTEMVMVILTRRQSVELKRFVRSVDPFAFVIMGDVTEVVGEGFKKWEADA